MPSQRQRHELHGQARGGVFFLRHVVPSIDSGKATDEFLFNLNNADIQMERRTAQAWAMFTGSDVRFGHRIFACQKRTP